MKPDNKYPLVFLLYLAAAVVITFPLIFQLTTNYHYFISSEDKQEYADVVPTASDTLVDIWIFKLFADSFSKWHSPATTNLIYGSDNYYVGSTINNWFSPAVSVILQPLFGLVGAFNIITLLILALDGFAAYVFAGHFTKNRTAAFLGGLSLLTSSYIYNRIQEHLGLSSVYPLIFYLYFFLLSLERGNKKHWILSALFLFLAGLNSWYFLFYGLIIGLILFGARVCARRSLTPLGYLTHLGTVGLLSLTFTLVFLREAATGPFIMVYEYAAKHSSDLFSFLIPNPQSSLWGKATLPAFEKIGFSLEKQSSFLGLLGIVSTIFYLFKMRLNSNRNLVVLFFSGIILSIGPVLTVFGTKLIPMPYALLGKYLPFLWAPSRFVVFSLIAESVFLAILLEFVLNRMGRSFTRIVVVVLVSLYLLIENAHFPFNLSPYNFGNNFYKSINTENENGIILNLPVSYDVAYANPYYLAEQTFSGVKMLNGYSTAVAYGNMQKTKYYSEELFPLSCQNYPIDVRNYGTRLRKFLESNNVAYVVVHKNLLRPDLCPKPKETIERVQLSNIFGGNIYEDENITAYKITEN